MNNGKRFIRPFPGVVRIEPAAACNLACTHCPTGTVPMRRGILASRTFARVLAALERQLSAIRVAVLYHGGEPLLNRRLAAMVRQIKQLGIPWVKTVSNGMLWSEGAMAEIVASGLDAVEFSLDGESPEENDAIRLKGSFAVVAENIHRLIAYKRRHGLNKPQVFLSSTRFLSQECDPTLPPEPPAYLQREFAETNAIAGFKCAWAIGWPGVRPATDLYQIRVPRLQVGENLVCDHVHNTVTVNWNGDVLGCCYDLTACQILGNVKEQNLEEIWNGPGYLELRRRIASGDLPPLCRHCNVVQPAAFLIRQPETECV